MIRVKHSRKSQPCMFELVRLVERFQRRRGVGGCRHAVNLHWYTTLNGDSEDFRLSLKADCTDRQFFWQKWIFQSVQSSVALNVQEKKHPWNKNRPPQNGVDTWIMHLQSTIMIHSLHVRKRSNQMQTTCLCGVVDEKTREQVNNNYNTRRQKQQWGNTWDSEATHEKHTSVNSSAL